jgi:hypothetical protein
MHTGKRQSGYCKSGGNDSERENEIHVPLVDGRQDNRSASLANPDYIVKDDENVTCLR